MGNEAIKGLVQAAGFSSILLVEGKKKPKEPKLLKACKGDYRLYNMIRDIKLMLTVGNKATAKKVEKIARTRAKELGVDSGEDAKPLR